MEDDNLDDLELELRMLPGVRAAGFDTQDDVLFVQLHMADSPAEPETMSATRIAARHAADRSVAVEIARWRTYAPPAPMPAEVEPTPTSSSTCRATCRSSPSSHRIESPERGHRRRRPQDAGRACWRCSCSRTPTSSRST